jgi:hypothetical protein
MLSSKKSLRKLGSCAKALPALLMLLCAACGAGESVEEVVTGAREKEMESRQVVNLPLPADGEVEGWRPAGSPTVFKGESLFEHINGGADIYYEYGFVEVAVEYYENGDKEVSVEIYRMDDAAAAFGIYSYNRHPTLSPVTVGGGGAIHQNGLFFHQDNHYVDIRRLRGAEIFKEEFLALAKAIEKKIGTTAEPPAIIKLLPEENKIERSEVFARGRLAINNQVYIASDDLFGLAKGEAAAIARYKLGQPEFSVIVAQYAGEETCGEAFARLRAHYLGEESERETEFAATAMPGKHHAVRIAGSRLLVVANADTKETALAMLDKVSDSVRGG